MKRLYLFVLEVTPMSLGGTYNPLPSHLTLMSRFWSDLSPDELAEAVKPLFRQTKSIELIFGEAAMLGPKQVAVHLVENTKELKDLHLRLHSLLNTRGVTYTAPQFVGNGHKPHVSRREGEQFTAGHRQMAKAAYLIEVEIKGKDHLRLIRAKFDLSS